jgi:hypothetical protein
MSQSIITPSSTVLVWTVELAKGFERVLNESVKRLNKKAVLSSASFLSLSHNQW